MRFSIDASLDGKLLRDFLKTDVGVSTTQLKHLKFTEGGILVNGKRENVRYTLRAGDVLDILMEDDEEDVSPYIFPVELPLDVVYEDEHLTVVNKPFDMPAHPSLGHPDDTVANALAYRYRDKTYVFRPVNRLDRNTSGLMLTANSRIAAYRASLDMRAGNIRKVYVAVLDGVPEPPCGIRKSRIRRKEGSIIEREETSDAGSGKAAVTAYMTIAAGENGAVVLASPLTGRTHQLRLHFAGMGCPITGDDLYGSASDSIGRQALHAAHLTLPHPVDRRLLSLTAALPDDMTALIRARFPDTAEEIIRLAEHFSFEDLKKEVALPDET